MKVDKFTPPHPLNTAILFLVFNRLDTTKKIFEAIRQAKPPRLYVAADGARVNVEGDVEKVQAVRNYVMQNIDWDCEVKTLLRDENLEDADIIFVYLLPNMMKRFAEIQVPTLKKGCIIISHGFALPNNDPIHTKKLSSVQGRVLVYKV